MKINIAGGRGPMGRIHKPVFENAGHEVIISGRYSALSLEEATKQSDLTIVSVPIEVTESVIRRIAPYCKAIMDFTSIKTIPINVMLQYSSRGCEVGGLHPLYGEVSSISGRTIVYCETERSGEKCKTITDTLESAGAKIKRMNPAKHDYIVNGIAQNIRVELLETFAIMLEKNGLNIRELYEISPPPTRILLDIIARQVDEKNDEMYKAMRKYNPFRGELDGNLLNALVTTINEGYENPERIREFFGAELKAAQERAKKLIEER